MPTAAPWGDCTLTAISHLTARPICGRVHKNNKITRTQAQNLTMNMPLCSSLEELDAVLRSVGRPTSYSPQVIDYLCSVITERGVSDSAAARLSKVSTSSLGRWKKEHPEVRYALLAAREEFRT